MAVKLTGSLSLTEINTEWTLGLDLDSYRGTQWFLSPSYSGPRSPRGFFGLESATSSVSYSDFYGTQRLSPPMTAGVWLVGAGGGSGGNGGGGGGGGIRPANVTLTGGGHYGVTVGGGGSGGYRNNNNPGVESTHGGPSSFHTTGVLGGGLGSSGGSAPGGSGSPGGNGGTAGYNTFRGNGQPGHPQGGGGGGATEGNNYKVGGKGGGYGAGGGNNIGFGPSAAPYAAGGGGGGGYQATQGYNGYRSGWGFNQNVDKGGQFSNIGNGRTSGFTPPQGRSQAGPGGNGTYYWAPLNMGYHGGGGGAGWSTTHGLTWPGGGGQGGGAAAAPYPNQPQTHNIGPNGGAGQGGGGGGGGSTNNAPQFSQTRGGYGGSGAVYLRYTAPQIGTGGPSGAHSAYQMSGYWIHKWTGSGYYQHS